MQGDDDGTRMQRLMTALADQAESAADAELLDEAAAAGIDVKGEANRVRTMLLNGVLAAKKERLRQAQRAHAASLARVGRGASRIPVDPLARKAMLNRVLQRQPSMREAVVTLQHREFEALSDSDIESVLRQLDALGALDDDEQKPK